MACRRFARIFRFVACLSCAIWCGGCASYVEDVPATAADVDFAGPEGHTGWGRYERTLLLRNTQLVDAWKAGGRALAKYDFALRKWDLQGAVIVGEHGETDWDTNLIGALYFRQEGEDVRVRIHVQASRGVGFFGHQADPDWTNGLAWALKGILQR